MRFPTFEEIVKINLRHLEEAQQKRVGTTNLRYEGSLKWVLEAIRYPLFGFDAYPSLVDKVALLAYVIITRHVFWDGNKRTGMSALEAFLRVNGYRLAATDDEMVEISRRLAGEYPDNVCSYGELVNWVRSKLLLRGTSTMQ